MFYNIYNTSFTNTEDNFFERYVPLLPQKIIFLIVPIKDHILIVEKRVPIGNTRSFGKKCTLTESRRIRQM